MAAFSGFPFHITNPYISDIISGFVFLLLFTPFFRPRDEALTFKRFKRHIHWLLKIWNVAFLLYVAICLPFAIFAVSTPSSRLNLHLAQQSECASRFALNRCDDPTWKSSFVHRECFALAMCLSHPIYSTAIYEIILEWARQFASTMDWFVIFIGLYCLLVGNAPNEEKKNGEKNENRNKDEERQENNHEGDDIEPEVLDPEVLDPGSPVSRTDESQALRVMNPDVDHLGSNPPPALEESIAGMQAAAQRFQEGDDSIPGNGANPLLVGEFHNAFYRHPGNVEADQNFYLGDESPRTPGTGIPSLALIPAALRIGYNPNNPGAQQAASVIAGRPGPGSPEAGLFHGIQDIPQGQEIGNTPYYILDAVRPPQDLQGNDIVPMNWNQFVRLRQNNFVAIPANPGGELESNYAFVSGSLRPAPAVADPNAFLDERGVGFHVYRVEDAGAENLIVPGEEVLLVLNAPGTIVPEPERRNNEDEQRASLHRQVTGFFQPPRDNRGNEVEPWEWYQFVCLYDLCPVPVNILEAWDSGYCYVSGLLAYADRPEHPEAWEDDRAILFHFHRNGDYSPSGIVPADEVSSLLLLDRWSNLNHERRSLQGLRRVVRGQTETSSESSDDIITETLPVRQRLLSHRLQALAVDSDHAPYPQGDLREGEGEPIDHMVDDNGAKFIIRDQRLLDEQGKPSPMSPKAVLRRINGHLPQRQLGHSPPPRLHHNQRAFFETPEAREHPLVKVGLRPVPLATFPEFPGDHYELQMYLPQGTLQYVNSEDPALRPWKVFAEEHIPINWGSLFAEKIDGKSVFYLVYNGEMNSIVSPGIVDIVQKSTYMVTIYKAQVENSKLPPHPGCFLDRNKFLWTPNRWPQGDLAFPESGRSHAPDELLQDETGQKFTIYDRLNWFKVDADRLLQLQAEFQDQKAQDENIVQEISASATNASLNEDKAYWNVDQKSLELLQGMHAKLRYGENGATMEVPSSLLT